MLEGHIFIYSCSPYDSKHPHKTKVKEDDSMGGEIMQMILPLPGSWIRQISGKPQALQKE